MGKIRVLIADDHPRVREGLRLILEAQPDIEVVDEAGDGREALGKARNLAPDVVIMDLTMPGISGLDATAAISHELANTKVLVVTVHDDYERFFQALRAGAMGYVVKTGSFAELVPAIRAVCGGAVYLCPSVAKLLASELLRGMNKVDEQSQTQVDSLTEREREVLKLVAEGKTSEEIAVLLSISIHTVHTHRSHILTKLGLRSRTDLVRYALRAGIIYE